MAATLTKNTSPHSTHLLRRIPYEQLLGTKPCVKHLHPFGIAAYVHTHAEARQPGGELLRRAEKGILVGYGRSMETTRVYIPMRNVI